MENKTVITKANGKTSAASRIKEWFQSRDEYELNEADQQVYNQTVFVWQRLLDRVRTEIIVKQCKKLFKVSRQTTYNRINLANSLFGNAIELDKNAERALAKNDLLEAIGWAKDAKDYNAINKLINTLAEITGQKGEDSIVPHFDKIQPQDIQLISSEKEKQVMTQLLDSGALDVDILNDAMDEIIRSQQVEAEDIEFEKV